MLYIQKSTCLYFQDNFSGVKSKKSLQIVLRVGAFYFGRLLMGVDHNKMK